MKLKFIPYILFFLLAASCQEKGMGHRTKRFFQWSGKMGERF